MIKKGSAFFAIVLLVTSCKVMPPKPPLVETVAVLLFDSESNDIDAPAIMQHLVYAALKKSSYKPLELNSVNETLEKAGIVDGGQLVIVDPVKLGKDLGVQALIFGYVESFDYTNIGFYLQRKVALGLRLVDVATGETLWENSGTGAHRELNLEKDKAAAAFKKGLAEQAIEKWFDSPLEEEAKLSVINCLRTLPGYNFQGFANDDNTFTKFKKGTKDVLKGTIRKR